MDVYTHALLCVSVRAGAFPAAVAATAAAATASAATGGGSSDVQACLTCKRAVEAEATAEAAAAAATWEKKAVFKRSFTKNCTRAQWLE